jgi:hypothetical protein
MSTIDIGKLERSLEKSGIIFIDYFLIDGKCGMIKAYAYTINQFLLLYISTKLRSEIKNHQNIYELKELSEVTDEEDYAKFDEYQINAIRQKMDADVYKNSAQKYNKLISLNGDGIEQFEKRITRQVKRLNIPFQKIDYTIGIQNKKIMALQFGDDINLFYIKNYSKDIRCYMYIVNVKELIENNSEIQSEIGSIDKQFYKIITDIIETNCKELKYDVSIDKLKKKEDEYTKKVLSFIEFINKLDDEEKKEIKKYKGLFQTETSTIKKNSLENEYQRIIESFLKKKIDKIENMIEQTYIFHIFYLLLEEISFDNFVMSKRMSTNIEKMQALFA